MFGVHFTFLPSNKSLYLSKYMFIKALYEGVSFTFIFFFFVFPLWVSSLLNLFKPLKMSIRKEGFHLKERISKFLILYICKNYDYHYILEVVYYTFLKCWFSINFLYFLNIFLSNWYTLSNPWYNFYTMSVYLFKSLCNSKYSTFMIVSAFPNGPFSGKTSPPVKNSYLAIFPDDEAKILAFLRSNLYRLLLFCILLSVVLIF